jgi:hypothetical protein
MSLPEVSRLDPSLWSTPSTNNDLFIERPGFCSQTGRSYRPLDNNGADSNTGSKSWLDTVYPILDPILYPINNQHLVNQSSQMQCHPGLSSYSAEQPGPVPHISTVPPSLTHVTPSNDGMNSMVSLDAFRMPMPQPDWTLGGTWSVDMMRGSVWPHQYAAAPSAFPPQNFSFSTIHGQAIGSQLQDGSVVAQTPTTAATRYNVQGYTEDNSRHDTNHTAPFQCVYPRNSGPLPTGAAPAQELPNGGRIKSQSKRAYTQTSMSAFRNLGLPESRAKQEESKTLETCLKALRGYAISKLGRSYRMGNTVEVFSCYINNAGTTKTQMTGVTCIQQEPYTILFIPAGTECMAKNCNYIATIINFSIATDIHQRPYIQTVTVSCSRTKHVSPGSHPAALCAVGGRKSEKRSGLGISCNKFATVRSGATAYCQDHLKLSKLESQARDRQKQDELRRRWMETHGRQ